MKKVTLLGDSIRLIGYATKVPELLGEDQIHLSAEGIEVCFKQVVSVIKEK